MKRSVFKVSVIGILVIALIVSVILQSCATYKYTTISKPGIVSYADSLQGRSLGIVPFKVNFYNSHPIAIEYVKMGNVYTKRYAYEEEDNVTSAKIGALCLNIFGDTKVDKSAIQTEFMNELTAGLKGESDYTVGFFKGLGEANMGELSNRAIDYDRTVNPPEVLFVGEALNPYFSEIKLLGETDTPTTDLVLLGEIAIDNEIQQYLSMPFVSPNAVPADEHMPQKDDYYVCTRASISFTLKEVGTEKVIASDKTKLDWPVTLVQPYDKFYLPIENQKAFYDLDQFKTLNYDKYARLAVHDIAKYILPYISPFVVNTTHAEVVKEEK